METLSKTPTPSVFSPLAKALLDGFSEGVVVFDREGKVLYANAQARSQLADQFDLSTGADELMPRLAALGGRVRPLRAGTLDMGEAMFLPAIEGPTTLADREKQAIVRTLDGHEWRLAETAKALGISRTTLWRRLRAYGLHRDGRSKWSPTSSPSA
jgi:transcriptional regulator with PAS, ATPase and Fis domain